MSDRHRTHWESCWRDGGLEHHACTVAEAARQARRAEAAELDSKIQRATARQLAGYVGQLENDLRLLPWERLAVLLEQADADAPAVDAFKRLRNVSAMLQEVQP